MVSTSYKVESGFWLIFDIIIFLGAGVTLIILNRYKLKVPLCFQLIGLILVSSLAGLSYDVLSLIEYKSTNSKYKAVADPIRATCLGIMNGTFVALYWLYAIKYYNASIEMPQSLAPQNLR
jgi:hypothetical protein